MDPKKPQSVNFGIQRDVLYLNPQVDVTELVLHILKSNVGASAPAPTTQPVRSTSAPAPTPTQQPLRSANGPGNNPLQRK